jgi:hypothetical protein
LRAFADLDLLIASGDLWQCHGLLRAGGFAPEIELDHRTARLFSAQETSLGFCHRGKNAAVELHWNFLPRCFDQRYAFDALWDARRSVALENRAVAALPDDGTMRYLLLHGFKHGWDRLCLAADLAHAAASLHGGWDAMLTDDGSGTMIRSGLLLADALVPDVLPGEAIERARRDGAARRLAQRFASRLLEQPPMARSIFTLGGIYVAGQRGVIRKVTFIWGLLFGVTAEDWKRWHFPSAWWRYQLLRPWRLLADHLLRPRP